MYPILFKIGSFQVHTYGVILMIAFLVGVYWAQRRGAPRGIPKGEIGDLCIWLLIAGVLGARLTYILQEFHSMTWKEILSFQFAGLTSFGGIVGGFIALLFVAKRRKRPAIQYLDVCMPPMVLGQAIGRVGCLLNGCCLGGVCDPHLPWGITVAGQTVHFHPAQIYESLMLLAGLAIIMPLERKGLFRPGQMFGIGLIVLGVCRFIYEFWRAGTDAQVEGGLASSTYWGSLPITQAQAVAGALAIAGIVVFIVYGRRPQEAVQTQAA